MLDQVTADDELKQVIFNSDAIKKALETICDSKIVNLTASRPEMYYSIDIAGKLLPLLADKFYQVRAHLAERYCIENAKYLLTEKHQFIRQETKGSIK